MVVTYERETLATLINRLEALQLPAHAALGRIRGQSASFADKRWKSPDDSQKKSPVSDPPSPVSLSRPPPPAPPPPYPTNNTIQWSWNWLS